MTFSFSQNAISRLDYIFDVVCCCCCCLESVRRFSAGEAGVNLTQQSVDCKQLLIVFFKLHIDTGFSLGWVYFNCLEAKNRRFSFTSPSFWFCDDTSVDSLLFYADQALFYSLRNIHHCLHPMLPDHPDVKAYHYNLRDRSHDLVSPVYRT